MREADRAKFAGSGTTDLTVPAAYLDELAALVSAAPPDAGASSKINGRWSEPIDGPSLRSTTARSSDTKA